MNYKFEQKYLNWDVIRFNVVDIESDESFAYFQLQSKQKGIINIYLIQGGIHVKKGLEIKNIYEISMDLIHPSPFNAAFTVRYKKGEILSSYDLLNYKQMLDVLGINLILIKENEFDDIINDEYIIIDDFIESLISELIKTNIIKISSFGTFKILK